MDPKMWFGMSQKNLLDRPYQQRYPPQRLIFDVELRSFNYGDG